MARRKKDEQPISAPVDERRFLAPAELRAYEAFHLKREIQDLKIKLLQQECKYHTLAKAHEELRGQLAVHKLADQQRSLESLLESHKAFNKEVRERYNIEGEVFGFHPETGEIALSK